MASNYVNFLPALRFLAVALVVISSAACVEYNDECVPRISNPDAVTGWLAGDQSLLPVQVRTKDSAIGQLFAESFYYAFDSMNIAENLRPDVALVNAGAIRSQGVCKTREILKKGPVKRAALREVFPFDDDIFVVTASHAQLKNILEHAVSGFSAESASSPSAWYLQVHGVKFTVDCANEPERLKGDARYQEGKRITSISLIERDGTEVIIPVDKPSTTDTVRIVTTDFYIRGGDYYIDFKAIDATNRTDTYSAKGGFGIIASHFLNRYTQQNPLPAEPAPRVTLLNCK